MVTLSGYDAWKTRSPDDEYPSARPECRSGSPYVCDYPRCNCAYLDQFYCEACLDVGWVKLFEDGCIVPCPECSTELELEDLADAHVS